MMDSRLLLILILGIQFNFSQQLQQQSNSKLAHQQANDLQIKAPNANQTSSTAEQQASVDAILSDTFMLLDALEQKLASASNKTPNALMRDNLRALDGASEGLEGLYAVRDPRERPEVARLIADPNPLADDEALVRFADSVSLERISELGAVEPMLAAASNEQSIPSAIINQSENPAPALDGKIRVAEPELTAAAMVPKMASEAGDGSVWGTTGRVGKLIQQAAAATVAAAAAEEHQTASADSAEQHLKFTLDLMQSIFSSQSYSAKTNSIESFLISPLSIQTVLMMMHLGARGQTRREIGQCLHLTPGSLADVGAALALENNAKSGPHQPLVGGDQHGEPSSTSTTDSANVKLLKRRTNQQQQQQQQIPSPLGANSGETGQQQQQQQHQQTSTSGNAHEIFGSAVRNLLKDPIVMKALTSANQIFLQKNLPLALQYERAIKHYYAADVKLVDFQRQSSAESSAEPVGSHQQEKGKLTAVSTSSSAEGSISATLPSSQANSNATKQNSANSSHLADSNFGARGSGEQLNNVQQLVNDWVERQSRGKISNFLASPVPSSTLMMAINVLYYKGDWQYKFDPSGTENNALFTQVNGKTVEMPMMVDTLPLAYAHDPIMKTSVIELPYKAQRLGLFLLLPDEISGIFHTMQMLNSTSFANLIASMRKQTPSADANAGAGGISVRIPKFNIDSSPRLSHILSQHLGLKTLFSPDVADLSGMFGPPQQVASNKRPAGNVTNNQLPHKTTLPATPPQVGLDEFLHKAVLQVDEHGSVAAASSAIMLERVGNGNGNYFEADHPFLLFLMDKQTGLVLFSGVFAGSNNGEEREVKQHQQQRHQRHL